jgi:hypothetical protein
VITPIEKLHELSKFFGENLKKVWHEREEYWLEEIKAERERSAKLIEALNWYWDYWNDTRDEIKLRGYKIAAEAIAEYEARK